MKEIKETKQEEKIRLFNWQDPELYMKLDRLQSLGDAILYILFQNWERGNKNLEKRILKTLVNRAGANTAGVRKIRDAITALRNAGALIVSRGGRGGGYRIAAGPEDVDACTENLFHSQAMSLLTTERAMQLAKRKRYPVVQGTMFEPIDGTIGQPERMPGDEYGEFDWMEEEVERRR